MSEIVPPAEEQISVVHGRLVTDFDEYTFRAPRPGFFLGDSRTPLGDLNPIAEFRLTDDGIPKCPPNAASLGRLGRLPFELLEDVLHRLDVRSLISFRATNGRATGIVETLRAFQTVKSFPRLLGAARGLECQFDVATLAACVRDTKCCQCRHFGDMFYLVAPRRFCYPCWRRVVHLETQEGHKIFWTVRQEMERARVPKALSSPGFYGEIGDISCYVRENIYDSGACYDLLQMTPIDDNAAAIAARAGPSHYRYFAVIRGPYLDTATGSFEEGFFCRACAFQGWEHRDFNIRAHRHKRPYPVWGLPWRRYTGDGMVEHLKRYGRVFWVPDGTRGRYAHERPFARYRQFEDNAVELVRMGSVLRRCRDKEIEFPPLQPFLARWCAVSTDRFQKCRHGLRQYTCPCSV